MSGNRPTFLCPCPRQPQKQKILETKHDNREKDRPSRTLLAMVAMSTGLVAIQSVVCFLSFFPRLSFGFFNNGVVKVYNIFRVSISPSELFFSLIPLCQVGQMGITFYTLVSLCLRTIQGPRLSNPSILNTMFFILWNTSTTVNVVWNFIFDRVFLTESAVLLLLSILTLTPTFGIASARLAFYQPQLESEKRRFDIIFLRSGVLNVLAMQITQAILSLIIEATVIASAAFSRPAIQEFISSISLVLMAILTLTFVGLDVSVLEPYTRSVLSPYMAIIMSTASMMRGSWNVATPSSTLKLAVLSSAVTGMATKLVVSVFNRNKPFIPRTNKKNWLGKP